MNTLGLIFLLGGFLLGRQVVVGRVMQTPEDIRDIALNVLSGDFDSLQRTLAQRGENVSPTVTDTVAVGPVGDDAPSTPNGSLLSQMVALGSQAKGYVWGADGPSYYDCSGLLWQAMRANGSYNGGRFTTGTFVKSLGTRISKIPSPSTGDIVLWPNHHIGVCSGPGQVYSAMSPSKGIGYSSISGITATTGVQPVYYRVNG